MSDNTKIEWCDSSWSPITGCTPISSGCKNCFAKRMAENRLRGRFGYPQDDPFRPGVVHRDKLDQPSRWKKPRKIFVCSMGDLFHEAVMGDDINAVWMEAFNNPRHIFIFLTKRPKLLDEWTQRKVAGTFWPIEDIWPSHMWIGTTIESGKHMDRAHVLRSIPAAVRFLSLEPMLGPMPNLSLDGIDWVIVGGETSPGARLMKYDWALDVLQQCEDAGVPFFFKGWGTQSVGKKDPGYRIINACEYNEFPEVK